MNDRREALETTRRRLLRVTALAAPGSIALLAGCPSPGKTVLDTADEGQPSRGSNNDDRDSGTNETSRTETPTEALALRSEPDYDGWFSDVENYTGTVVYDRDRERVTVTVGAKGNGGRRAFDPPAIAIPKGAEVVWEWADGGEAYNVVAVDGEFRSGNPTANPQTMYRFSFETEGVYKYYSTPQRSAGMKGAVAVYTPT